ncbi:MAG TPA: TldD/PmbA family protein [Acidimicrobiales bacterium]|nr:TldD/PmbA family protein [Acidimicrobiales bacterium]
MPELLDLAERIAADAQTGEEVEAYVGWHRSTDIRVFEGGIESLSSAESSGVGVRVISGGRQGFAYVGNLDEGLAREALAEARDNANFASVDEHAGLARPDGHAAVDLELWSDTLADFPSEEKIALAIELERLVRAGDGRIRQVVSSDYGDGAGESAIATSTGISTQSRKTACFISADAVAGEGEDTQTGAGYSVGRGPEDLAVDVAATDAIDRATRLLGATKPRSDRLSVVFDRRVTAMLLSILSGTLSGEDVAKGRSLFAGRLGEEVAVPSFTLVDDPTNPLAYGASRYDAEGLACRRNPLIEGGRLSTFMYDSYSARLAGTVSTASAVRGGFKSGPGVGARALALDPGENSQEELIALVGDGLFVQEINGVHSGVNPVSGDFSVGAEGLMIRNGTLGEPVREITIASSIQRMLLHILAIGNDTEWLPSTAAGVSLAITEISMSGE